MKKTDSIQRKKIQLYPDYSAEIKAIDETIGSEGIEPKLLYRIINKHRYNSKFNEKLYERYKTLDESVPIFNRIPRFDESSDTVNNKLNNDFFSDIVDFKVGYFAGKPVGYSYSTTKESEEMTGGEEAIDVATKALTDFVTRNNMYDVDMQTTKYATICGYSGRLFYIDPEGNERVMPVSPFETIVLSNTNMTEPEYAIRYYSVKDINDRTVWKVEFYDSEFIYYYEGSLSNLVFINKQPHLFDYCPLQGIPNNEELMGDAEKVLSLIDAYDRTASDSSNEIESFANSYMVFENVQINEEEIKKAQKSGAISFFNGGGNGKVYFLTKDINDTFNENFLNRLEDNIYRFSKTPNLNDESFGSASGISLKFKLTGLETKCGMFEAKMMSAGTYMFKLLASAWSKKKITVDPLQCMMEFKRNFPLDVASEADTVQKLKAAGLPDEIAFKVLSFIDDIDYVMELIEAEKDSIPALNPNELINDTNGEVNDGQGSIEEDS